MAKYHQNIYDAVAAGDMRRVGVRLAAACIDAQIPVQIVSRWMGISRQGVYYWFTGETDVAVRHQPKVEKITAVLISALDAGELPAKDLPTALDIIKKYRSSK